MLVFLRNSQTKLYYAGHGRWVTKPNRALAFQTVEEALLLNRQEHLHEMEIVYQHSASGSTRVLPIGQTDWHKERVTFF
ncbi:MAG TPA: hypothetical protein VNT26_05905 [Candidatus Sulfotelmatobacter sp.]|nr:hypothetical protein [Candidatus Sulfotelmatobacter sp.]HWI56191.1 hypothetical protein [Bacillota bacterium]